MPIDGIYTAYLSGVAGQSMAMFVFTAGTITGADIGGLVYSGNYKASEGRVAGHITYRMPAASVSITGAEFVQQSEDITVPIDLPETLNEKETYRINTPIGPINAKFIKNAEL